MAGGWGGARPGSGRPKGSPSLKSEALAGRLDELGCDPAEALVRLGNKAEAAGDVDLAIKAFTALMPFRWPKLKESAIDLGLGLSGGLAGQLEAARARLQITVVSGIDRPPDDPAPITADPVPPASPSPAPQASPSPPASPPQSSPPPPAPSPAAGQAVPAHEYWTRKREPEMPLTDYDPWETT
jgi:hypothetical protein